MWFFKKKADDALWGETNKKVLGLAREKKTDEALTVAKELYEYTVRAYGKRHQRTVKAINNLGYVFTQKRDFDKAESYLLMGLEISEKIHGKYSREVAFVNVNLSKLYMAKAQEIFDMEGGYKEVFDREEKSDNGNFAESC